MYWGMIMVTTDMSLALLSVLLNLMVLNGLREKEFLLSKTHNLILANICCANLVSQSVHSGALININYSFGGRSSNDERHQET